MMSKANKKEDQQKILWTSRPTAVPPSRSYVAMYNCIIYTSRMTFPGRVAILEPHEAKMLFFKKKNYRWQQFQTTVIKGIASKTRSTFSFSFLISVHCEGFDISFTSSETSHIHYNSNRRKMLVVVWERVRKKSTFQGIPDLTWWASLKQ